MLDLFGDEFSVIETKKENDIDFNIQNNIKLTSQVNKDIYTDYIGEAFDLHIGDFVLQISH